MGGDNRRDKRKQITLTDYDNILINTYLGDREFSKWISNRLKEEFSDKEIKDIITEKENNLRKIDFRKKQLLKEEQKEKEEIERLKEKRKEKEHFEKNLKNLKAKYSDKQILFFRNIAEGNSDFIASLKTYKEEFNDLNMTYEKFNQIINKIKQISKKLYT